MKSAIRTCSRRAGSMLIYSTALLIPLLCIAALAVDWGHVRIVKTELQGATDAAALAGAAQLQAGASASTAASAAITFAPSNAVDKTSFTLQSTDVSTGRWASNIFTAGGTPTNAVMVVGYRTKARGTAVNLIWLAMLGISTQDVTATSIACESGGSGYGIVAISSANINNSLYLDGYNSSMGSYSITKGSTGSIANGGSWNLSNTADINGNLYYSGTQPTNGTVTGTRTALPASPSLSTQYPLVPVPTGTTNSGNYNGGSMTLSSGNYWYTSFSLNSSDVLTISGTVNLYVSGNINLNGTVTNNGTPANFKVYNTVAAGVNITSSGNLTAEIYAPSSPINLNGSMNFYGTMVGSQLSTSGGQSLHVDTSQIGGATSLGTVR